MARFFRVRSAALFNQGEFYASVTVQGLAFFFFSSFSPPFAITTFETFLVDWEVNFSLYGSLLPAK